MTVETGTNRKRKRMKMLHSTIRRHRFDQRNIRWVLINLWSYAIFRFYLCLFGWFRLLKFISRLFDLCFRSGYVFTGGWGSLFLSFSGALMDHFVSFWSTFMMDCFCAMCCSCRCVEEIATSCKLESCMVILSEKPRVSKYETSGFVQYLLSKPYNQLPHTMMNANETTPGDHSTAQFEKDFRLFDSKNRQKFNYY